MTLWQGSVPAKKSGTKKDLSSGNVINTDTTRQAASDNEWDPTYDDYQILCSLYFTLLKSTFKKKCYSYAAYYYCSILCYNLLCWNVRGIMSSAYSRSETHDKKCIDIALITEHKLLPRSQHFLDSINCNFYSLSPCDTTMDNFGHYRCGKAGCSILVRKSLRTLLSKVNNINNNCIVGIELRNHDDPPLYLFCVYHVYAF